MNRKNVYVTSAESGRMYHDVRRRGHKGFLKSSLWEFMLVWWLGMGALTPGGRPGYVSGLCNLGPPSGSLCALVSLLESGDDFTHRAILRIRGGHICACVGECLARNKHSTT